MKSNIFLLGQWKTRIISLNKGKSIAETLLGLLARVEVEYALNICSIAVYLNPVLALILYITKILNYMQEILPVVNFRLRGKAESVQFPLGSHRKKCSLNSPTGHMGVLSNPLCCRLNISVDRCVVKDVCVFVLLTDAKNLHFYVDYLFGEMEKMCLSEI